MKDSGHRLRLLILSRVNASDDTVLPENKWHRHAKIIGVLAACVGFLLLLIDDLIPRYQQGQSLFSETSEILEFLLLCPGFGILALLSAQYVYQREYDLKRKIDRLEAKRFVALGRIAGSLAHEVRNPLHNIMLVSEELLAQNHDDQHDLLQHLSGNIERINIAVKLVYELAKPVYQIEDDFADNISLRSVVDVAVERVATDFTTVITLEGIDETVQVVGNSSGITLALENVLRNAVQYCEKHHHESHNGTDAGIEGVHISVQSESQYYVLRIVNQGILPQELLEGTSETFTTNHSGLGLGLYITRHLLERMQGKLRVEQCGKQVVVALLIQRGVA